MCSNIVLAGRREMGEGVVRGILKGAVGFEQGACKDGDLLYCIYIHKDSCMFKHFVT